MAEPKWDLPPPEYDKDMNHMIKTYKRATNDVLDEIVSLSTYGEDKEFQRAEMRKVLAYIASRLKTVDKETEEWVNEKIEMAFKNGQAETIVALGEAESFDDAIGAVAATDSILDARNQLITDTYNDLLQANKQMKEETIRMVRNVAKEEMSNQAAQDKGRKTTKKALRERFKEEGNIAIRDNKGRRWTLERYSEMVTRTKMLQAHVEGTRREAKNRNVDLAIVSSHNAKDACRHFEGQIISMNGETDGFMTYEELRRSNLIFHPNCRHKVTPIRSLDILPDNVRSRIESDRPEAERLLQEKKNK
ncbi:hypothetical protein CHL76_02170 [Marinococcus halophilus]|uniref:Minor capsid protein n=1 Tax=Marinococcus halophilus TaxID=1371 RepID=A0A510Y1B8_MARHA|nr:phage minor capsid protein [Marinococcus halophilus]OZT81182.1 hypothetical protein CHL76_02170 [Marinococcus halophilus]GEK57115.1 hypothetical protein MHA01_00200 [Marinococcus halophilus]